MIRVNPFLIARVGKNCEEDEKKIDSNETKEQIKLPRIELYKLMRNSRKLFKE